MFHKNFVVTLAFAAILSGCSKSNKPYCWPPVLHKDYAIDPGKTYSEGELDVRSDQCVYDSALTTAHADAPPRDIAAAALTSCSTIVDRAEAATSADPLFGPAGARHWRDRLEATALVYVIQARAWNCRGW